MPALLARFAPRSERDPDLEAATASLAMNPVTGAFADPSHESAFAAQFFRKAYPAHVVLLTFCLASFTFIALTWPTELRVFTATVALLTALGLLGRALLHRMADTVGAQRMGSWTWTAIFISGCVTDIAGCIFARAAACTTLQDFLYPTMTLAIALTNGSHGMGFAHKFTLTAFPLVFSLVKLTVCYGERALALAFCEIGALGAGSAAAHMAELYLRYLYAEEERLEEEKRRLEVRNEQLQAEKERLLYDMQRRGHPIDDDNRSAIRRGLQGTHPSEAGGPAPSDSPPPSLPPGAPSSTAGESSIAPPPVSDAGSMSDMSEVEEAVTDLMGDEEVVLELQSSGCSAARAQGALQLELRGVLELQSSPPAGSEGGGESDGAKPPASLGAVPRAENVADVAVVHQPRVIAHRVQEAIDSTPQGQGGKRQRQGPHLQVGPRVGVLVGLPVRPPVKPSCGPLPESLDHGQGNRTPRQQALHVARQSLQVTRTDLEIFQVVRALSLALGSVRTESGTVKAVHAVLLQMNRPEMSEKEAYTSTGASMSNFKKWRRRIQHAELNLPPP